VERFQPHTLSSTTTTPMASQVLKKWMDTVYAGRANPMTTLHVGGASLDKLGTLAALFQRIHAEHVVATAIERPAWVEQFRLLEGARVKAQEEQARLAVGELRAPQALMKDAAQLYMPRLGWELQPSFTGVIVFKAFVVAAFDEALNAIRTHIPGLAELTLDEIIYAAPESGLLGCFCRFAGLCISQTNLSFPRTYMKDIQYKERDRQRSKKFQPLKDFRVNSWYNSAHNETTVEVVNTARNNARYVRTVSGKKDTRSNASSAMGAPRPAHMIIL
jgi:hypothetical protein